MRLPKPKARPEFKIADDFLQLRDLDANVIIQQLEENMRLREMPLEKQVLRTRKRF